MARAKLVAESEPPYMSLSLSRTEAQALTRLLYCAVAGEGKWREALNAVEEAMHLAAEDLRAEGEGIAIRGQARMERP